MKKLTVLSIVAASLLLVGCGDSATGAEAKAAAETKVEAPAAETKTAEAAAKKCGEGKCGGDKKSAATEAKEAVATAVEKTKEAVVEKAAEVKDAVAEKATAATAAVAATATAAVESTKEAASAVAEKATEAVAAATGPDGKALFAKCAGCHGADGKTAALGKSAVIAGQSAADLETKIAGYKAGTRNVAGMGALMKGQVATYSDEDIKAVSAFIAGL